MEEGIEEPNVFVFFPNNFFSSLFGPHSVVTGKPSSRNKENIYALLWRINTSFVFIYFVNFDVIFWEFIFLQKFTRKCLRYNFNAF